MSKYKNAYGEVFEVTQYKEGDKLPKGIDSIGDGVYVLTNKDGEIKLCHPTVFKKEYKKEGK